MCGIVGYTGKRPVIDLLLKGLHRLEYRGYDSAGVAFFKGPHIQIQKSKGKLENVERLLDEKTKKDVTQVCGIGHTRWATHGSPTTQNAHPHRTGHVVLVHNGIIENYQDIKKEIIAQGHQPASETDSELFGFLVLNEMNQGKNLIEAVRKSFGRLRGNCSVVIMSEKEPGLVVGVRNGSPLVAAIDPEGGAILASDAQPLLEYTRKVVFLENGDMAICTAKGLEIRALVSGAVVERKSQELDWTPDQMEKQGYPHYMLKEIHEQPMALVDTLNALTERARTDPFPLARQPAVDLLSRATRITITACGTSWHAAWIGKYWLERWAQIPVSVELASEFRYRDPVLMPNELIIGMSQSGETADTLAVIRDARARGFPTLAITNVRNSSISRESETVLYTSAGPEIGVAATKTFTTQILTLLLISGFLGLKRSKKNAKELDLLFQDLVKLPHLLEVYTRPEGELTHQVKKAAKAVKDLSGFFFIGRGTSFPMAQEASLKLKEIAYVHAEGYAAGELKHGPIAMIDKGFGVVVLAPPDSWKEKTVSNLEEVKARGAVIIGVGSAEDEGTKGLCDHWITLPKVSQHTSSQSSSDTLMPFLLAPVVQLLSYEIAVLKGTDIDKPRNLAKSVTVE